MTDTPRTTQTRSLTIPLGVANDEHYRAVVGSIRRVRAAARQAYAVVFAAQAAGATIETDADGSVTVKPNNARARTILAETMAKTGKAPLYQLREYVLGELMPNMRSFVWDDLRRFVWARWQAKDPEFPRAGRGWLTLQNVRGLAIFRGTGIGFPAAVLRSDALQHHRVRLSWDKSIGAVEFRIGDLDPGVWSRWRRIVDGELDHGTIVLNERDGKLRLTVSYEHPIDFRDVDPERRIVVRLAESADGLVIAGPDGATTFDTIAFAEAAGWAARLKRQSDARRAELSACGSPRREWGEPRRFRAVSERLNRITKTRERGMRGRNHAWAKRVVARAKHWRCGTVVVEIPSDATMCGHPWGWAHLRQCVEYKLAVIAPRTTHVQA